MSVFGTPLHTCIFCCSACAQIMMIMSLLITLFHCVASLPLVIFVADDSLWQRNRGL